MTGLSTLSRSLCDKMENASDKTRQLMQEVNDFKKSILSQDSQLAEKLRAMEKSDVSPPKVLKPVALSKDYSQSTLYQKARTAIKERKPMTEKEKAVARIMKPK